MQKGQLNIQLTLMWYQSGSDGFGGTSGHRCVVWASYTDYYRIVIEILEKLNVV